jgi:hypothetical protein
MKRRKTIPVPSASVLRIRDPVLLGPLDPSSESGIEKNLDLDPG